jgi:hypothetical protein
MRRVVFIVIGLGLIGGTLIEASTRLRIQTRYQTALREKRRLETQLAQLRSERDRLFEVLKSEQRRAEQSSQQLVQKDQQLQDVLARLAQEDLIVNDLQQRLQATQLHADRLQEELVLALNAASSGSISAKAVELERVIVEPAGAQAPSPNGRVVSVHPEWRFVVVDLGWDSVEIGDVISIYRRDQLLGKARVERVQEAAAAATLLPEWAGTEIQVDDVVRAL